MLEALVLFLLAALPLLGSPGPATLSIAATGSVYGVARGAPYMVGVVLGTIVVVLLVATGLTGLLFAIPGVLPVLSVAALCYILYLAYKIATAPVLAADVEKATAPSLYGGLLLAIANPKAFAAVIAVFASITVYPEHPVIDAALKSAALAVLVTGVNCIWLALGAALSRLLHHPRLGRVVNIGFAILLLLSVGLVVLM
ncbi:MAG: LysE family transporter [Alphaproteobacteria bacterium]|nr:LysE family transporter [Alphaproteobacteria bacterium]